MYFNPRTREGCDIAYITKPPIKLDISIHAPARGATYATTGATHYQGYFNPRTREGCDIHAIQGKLDITDFNPRTREGCDKGGGV